MRTRRVRCARIQEAKPQAPGDWLSSHAASAASVAISLPAPHLREAVIFGWLLFFVRFVVLPFFDRTAGHKKRLSKGVLFDSARISFKHQYYSTIIRTLQQFYVKKLEITVKKLVSGSVF